jgi:hypothetical protein
MREARTEMDDSHDERRNQRQKRRRPRNRALQRAGEGPLEEGRQPEEGRPSTPPHLQDAVSPDS